MPTPEQHDADEALRSALLRHAEAYDVNREGELLDQALVVTSWLVPEGTEEGHTAYGLQMFGGTMPLHACLGLISVAEAQLLSDSEDGD